MINKKEKIFINGRFLTQNLTGVQRYAYQIVKHLLATGLEVQILVPRKVIKDSYDVKGWPIVFCGTYGGHRWEQWSLPLYLSGLKRQRVNYILLNLCNTAPLLVMNRVMTLHDISFVENPGWFKRSFATYYKLLIPLLLKRSKAIITVSDFSRKEIERHYPFTKGRVQVIYNAASVLPAVSPEQEAAFLSTNRLTRGKYILSVSSVEPRKNLKGLIEAYRKLGLGDMPLVLTGTTGNSFSDAGIDIGKGENIIMLGYVKDEELKILYQNAACFAYLSFYEGFGLPPVEAMANGCPVIVSRIPSLEEVCGDAALYADPYVISEIAEQLLFVKTDVAQQQLMRSKGLARITFFDWRKSAEQLKTILEQVSRDC